MRAGRIAIAIGFAIVVAGALGACDRAATPPVGGGKPAKPAAAAPDAPKPTPRAQANDVPMFTYEDVAGVAFGESPEAVARAWPGGVVQGTEERAGACHFAYTRSPAEESFGVEFVFDARRMVRVDVDSPGETAPGGGRVGMDLAQVRAAYPGLVEQPHPFVPGARNLVVTAPGGASRLVFELNPSGHVTAWHLGLATPPGQGCA